MCKHRTEGLKKNVSSEYDYNPVLLCSALTFGLTERRITVGTQREGGVDGGDGGFGVMDRDDGGDGDDRGVGGDGDEDDEYEVERS